MAERSRNYWLHRITGGDNAMKLSHPLLFDHNILSIGWSYLAAEVPTFLTDIKNGEWEAFESYFEGQPRNRYSLWRFLVEMRKGDIVVVPTWGEFSIYEITDDEILSIKDLNPSYLKAWYEEIITVDSEGYLSDSNNVRLDLGFFRRVTPIVLHLSRQEYATQMLYSRMKVFQTNVSLYGLKEDVKEACARKKQHTPINLYEELQNATIEEAKHVISKYIKDKQYEKLVEKYLMAIGAEVEDTSYDKTLNEEGDADRVATFHHLKLKIRVQVKKHGTSTQTGVHSVNQIEQYAEHHPEEDYFTQNWVISNADEFTEEAYRDAKQHDIRLINGTEFARMILDVGLKHFE